MDPDPLMLARLLSLGALIAATIDYVEVVERRVRHRAYARERALLEESGLRGLARIFLSEPEPLAPSVLLATGSGEQEYWPLARSLARSSRYA
jgi:hypothetical protein